MVARDQKRQDGLDLAPAQSRVRRVPVLLPYPFPGPFDYRVPPGMDAAPGDLVLVPLNNRAEVGVVWDGPTDESLADSRLKPVAGLIEGPPMRADLRRLVDWIASYTLATPGEVLAMALRTNALRPETPPVGWRLADAPPEARLTEPRQRVLAALAGGAARGSADLARAADVSAAVIRGMADAGFLVPTTLPIRPAFSAPTRSIPARFFRLSRPPPPPHCARRWRRARFP